MLKHKVQLGAFGMWTIRKYLSLVRGMQVECTSHGPIGYNNFVKMADETCRACYSGKYQNATIRAFRLSDIFGTDGASKTYYTSNIKASEYRTNRNGFLYCSVLFYRTTGWLMRTLRVYQRWKQLVH